MGKSGRTHCFLSDRNDATLAEPSEVVDHEPPCVYRRVKHSKDEPYNYETIRPAYPTDLRERGVRLFQENRADDTARSHRSSAVRRTVFVFGVGGPTVTPENGPG